MSPFVPRYYVTIIVPEGWPLFHVTRLGEGK
jgi:hypothetical protein